MARQQGTKLKIYEVTSGGDVAIAHLRSNNLTLNGETIDISTKSSNNWREYLSGYRGWTMSGEGLADFAASGGETGADKLTQYWIDGTMIKIKQTTGEGADPEFIGDAIITNITFDAPHEDAVTFTIEFQGSGELAID